MTDISIVTTCKGRLRHLEQTLPRMVAQEGVECVVVDYGCPQGSGDWVSAHYPDVRVVRVTDDPGFSASRARNLGARAARGPWLAFVDADILLAPAFARTLRPLLRPGSFLLAEPVTGSAFGTCVCLREEFRSVGGYDEVLRNWGGEDRDLYLRLQMRGIRRGGFPAGLISTIAHDDAARLAHSDVKDTELLLKIARLYVGAKTDVLRLSGRPLPLEARGDLYQRARHAVLQAAEAGSRRVVMELSFPRHPSAPSHDGWSISSKITYTITESGEPGSPRTGDEGLDTRDRE
jgi:glycosyltransferase involved in cell wall biosynthesis